jgi:hypothetical protein
MTKRAPNKPKLDKETIEKYVHTALKIDALTLANMETRNKILDALRAGAVCSPDSPWELYESKEEYSNVPWKEVAELWIRKVMGRKWTIEVARLESKYRVSIPVLRKRANPDYLAPGG